MKRSLYLMIAIALVFSPASSGLCVSSLYARGGDVPSGVPAGQQHGETAQPGRPAQENLAASAAPGAAIAEQQKAGTARAEVKAAEDETVVKTYALRYVNWREVEQAARLYLYASSGSDNTLTVRLPRKYLPDFEALLKKLDVERKNIMFRVFTIIAAKDGAPDIIKKPETREIENRDLKMALDEIRGLWNFKRYWVEAPSFLTVKDGSEGSHVRLVAGLLDFADFGMSMRNVRLTGDESGKRNITVGELKLDLNVNTPNASRNATLIDTQEISVKEKGYLVVGVSGLETGWSGLALILVISAEIK